MNAIDFIVIIIIGFFLTNFSIEKLQEGFNDGELDLSNMLKKYEQLDKLLEMNAKGANRLNNTTCKNSKHTTIPKCPSNQNSSSQTQLKPDCLPTEWPPLVNYSETDYSETDYSVNVSKINKLAMTINAKLQQLE